MRAAYYEKNGTAREVLSLGDIDTPTPGPGEVRVRLRTSGVNPSDVKSREGRTRKIAFPRVIPHSDGAGDIDAVGDGVPKSRVGERVWTWNGQRKRPFGTCADYIVLPAALAVKLPDHISYDAGACLGIPAMTAYHAVELAEPPKPFWFPVAQAASATTQSNSPRRAGRLLSRPSVRTPRPSWRARPARTTRSTTSARMSANG